MHPSPSPPASSRRRLQMPSAADLRRLATPFNLFVAVDLLVIVVSGAILFMVLVKWIRPDGGSKQATDDWIEVSSQVLNAVFTLNALLTAPSRMLNAWRLIAYHALRNRLIRASAAPINPSSETNVRARVRARHLADRLEAVYSPLRLPPLPPAPSNPGATPTKVNADADDDDDVNNDDPTTASTSLDPAVFPLFTWYSIIAFYNLNCHFQWPMAAVMWGWAADYHSRPSYLVYTFLVLSFVCGGIAGIWQAILSGRIAKARKAAKAAGTDPAAAAAASTDARVVIDSEDASTGSAGSAATVVVVVEPVGETAPARVEEARALLRRSGEAVEDPRSSHRLGAVHDTVR
ncbi:hypothetical protein HK405_005151 [Cladochytrium tenue]|nr:hypothetical protein HK405_005151 [Cladochytrium tenue]